MFYFTSACPNDINHLTFVVRIIDNILLVLLLLYYVSTSRRPPVVLHGHIGEVYQSCQTVKTSMKGCEYDYTTVTCMPLIDLLKYIKFSSIFTYKDNGN